MHLFLVLLAGHFISDFPLQQKYMLEDKQKAFVTSLGTLTLISHAMTHALVIGGLAALQGVTGYFPLGVVIGATHFFIDLGKIRHRYGVMTDQVLHYFVILLCVFYFQLWTNL